MKTPNPKTLLQEAEDQKEEYESVLRELVEMPTVSSDPERKETIRKCAFRASQLIQDAGGSSEVIESEEAHPLVYGTFSSSKKHPTVTIYNHLDVIPASRETEPWETEPFTFTKKENRYFGRGTTDDKGPVLAAFFGARMARKHGIPINIRFLWECEEEIGSPNFEKLVRKARVRTDSVVISDTMWLSRTRPTITAGLRGFVGVSFLLSTGSSDQHSGDVGGVARNPLAELMQLVSEIHDAKSGRILIPHFYDDVVAPTRSEVADFRASGVTNKWFKKTYGYNSLRAKEPLEIMKRMWTMPTFEIHGVTGGYDGPGLKSIVPASGEVKASFRLAYGQNPARVMQLVRKFVQKRNRDVRLVFHPGCLPFLTKTSGLHADAARNAIRFAFGKKPAFVREGGSISGIPAMEKILKCPVMFLGLSLPEHGYHAPNENFDWHQASHGMAAFVAYFDAISRFGSAAQ